MSVSDLFDGMEGKGSCEGSGWTDGRTDGYELKEKGEKTGEPGIYQRIWPPSSSLTVHSVWPQWHLPW